MGFAGNSSRKQKTNGAFVSRLGTLGLMRRKQTGGFLALICRMSRSEDTSQI